MADEGNPIGGMPPTIAREDLLAHVTRGDVAPQARRLAEHALASLGWAEKARFGEAEIVSFLLRVGELAREGLMASGQVEQAKLAEGLDAMMEPVRRKAEALGAGG